MSKRIKGITIKIGGDTTGLNKALESTDKKISKTQDSLRDINRLLKLDPGNTDLIAQKHRVLGEQIDAAKDKLKQLRSYDKQLQSSLKSGEIGQEQYDAFQREITATKTELKNLKKEYQNTSSAAGKMTSASTTISSVSGKVSNATRGISTAAAGLGAAMISTVPATEELRTDLSKLDNNAREAGQSTEDVRNIFKQFAVATDEVDSSVEATSNLLQAGFSGTALQEAMEGITGAYLSFPDTMKIESLADSLQETLATGEATGQFGELLDRLGIGADTFSEKLANCSTEAEKQNLILQTLSDEGLNDTYNGWLKNNEALTDGKEANLEMQLVLAKLAETIQPFLTKIVEIATTVIEWFNNLDPAAQKMIIAILGIVAAISPIAGIISAISAASAASPVTWIVLGIVAAVAALVAVIILLIENWDSVKAAAQSALETIIGWVQSLIDWVKDAVDWVKELFGWKKKSDDQGIGDTGDFTGNANGGTVGFGGLSVVGERGPELLRMTPLGARITPLTAQRSATFNNTFTFNGQYTESDGRAIVESINKQLGRIL